MHVGEILGLEGNSLLLADARRRWSSWGTADGRLAEVGSYDGFQAYLAGCSPSQADGARLALAKLGAQDGGDEVAAAAALAASLVPGAMVLAGRLIRLGAAQHVTGGPRARVHEMVAAQLWIEVRSFPWQRLSKVGGNILMNCRAAVLADLGDVTQLERRDRTWARTRCVDEHAVEAAGGRADRNGWGGPGGGLPGGPAVCATSEALARVVGESPTAAEEVTQVLDWATENEVITSADRHLILILLREAHQVDVRATTRGRGNLCSAVLTERVAPLLGISPATVRRRAARSLQALADSVPSGLCA